MIRNMSLGATYLGDNRCQFRVWVPKAENVAVHIVDLGSSWCRWSGRSGATIKK